MTNVALIMRPWILTVKNITGISCFILADDVLIVGAGMKMLTKFAGALNATHEYLHQMGAKVAPDKKTQLCQQPQSQEVAYRNDLGAHR